MSQASVNELAENVTKASLDDAKQSITPWDVQGAVVDGKQTAIDYDRLCDDFGTQRIKPELLERFERLTGHRPHRFLRRNIFFSHRYGPRCRLSYTGLTATAISTKSWTGMRKSSPSSSTRAAVPAAMHFTWAI